MPQACAPPVERRKDVRHPRAFAFWHRAAASGPRVSGWMLNMSAGGAAFLTATEHAPPVGTRLELSEMPTRDRLVREGAWPLPRYARVVRHDDEMGVTCKVAVRFEAECDAPLSRAIEAESITAGASVPGRRECLPGGEVTRAGESALEGSSQQEVPTKTERRRDA